MVREYIGARYVPKFMGTYDPSQAYEALCVVDNGMGTSYITKIPTPAGTPLTDTDYYTVYGASSGAIINLQNQIDDINSNIQSLIVTPEMFGAIGDGVTDDLQAFQDALAKKVPIVLANNGTYLVSDTIVIESGAYIIGNNATITKTAQPTHPIIENKGRTSGVADDNIYITSLNLVGSGSSQVSDQGSGITIYRANNVVIDNIITSNTNGDGILLRDCTASVKNVSIGNYGRNGISPCSGVLSFDNVSIDGVAITGANPGLPIDCESDSQEKGVLRFTNCKLHKISIVDFYTPSGNFCYDILIENCEFLDRYKPIVIKATNALAANIVIGKNNKITGHGSLVSIDNVNGVDIDAEFMKVDASGTSTVGILLESDITNLTIRNLKKLDNADAEIYTTHDITGSALIDCDDIRVFVDEFNDNKLISTNIANLNCNASSNGNNFDLDSFVEISANLSKTLQTFSAGDAFKFVDKSMLTSTVGTITGGVLQIGKLVFYGIRITTTSAIAADDTILSGLPTPFGAARIPITTNVGVQYDSYMTSSGEVKSLSPIVNGSYIYLQGVYVAS